MKVKRHLGSDKKLILKMYEITPTSLSVSPPLSLSAQVCV